jgi:hypothetical protein
MKTLEQLGEAADSRFNWLQTQKLINPNRKWSYVSSDKELHEILDDYNRLFPDNIYYGYDPSAWFYKNAGHFIGEESDYRLALLDGKWLGDEGDSDVLDQITPISLYKWLEDIKEALEYMEQTNDRGRYIRTIVNKRIEELQLVSF